MKKADQKTEEKNHESPQTPTILDELSVKDRQAVEMKANGASHQEISQALGIAEDTSRQYFDRTGRLRKYLDFREEQIKTEIEHSYKAAELELRRAVPDAVRTLTIAAKSGWKAAAEVLKLAGFQKITVKDESSEELLAFYRDLAEQLKQERIKQRDDHRIAKDSRQGSAQTIQAQ